jgi:hypothetical protein
VIPLADSKRSEVEIRRLTQGEGLDDGQGAELRRQMQERLRASVDKARGGEASVLAVSTTLDGVPIPASLVITFLNGPADVPALDDPWLHEDGAEVLATAVPAGSVVRRTGRTVEEDVENVVVNYWLSAEQGHVLLTFSTPLVLLEAPLSEMFDAIVESAWWVAD